MNPQIITDINGPKTSQMYGAEPSLKSWNSLIRLRKCQSFTEKMLFISILSTARNRDCRIRFSPSFRIPSPNRHTLLTPHLWFTTMKNQPVSSFWSSLLNTCGRGTGRSYRKVKYFLSYKARRTGTMSAIERGVTPAYCTEGLRGGGRVGIRNEYQVRSPTTWIYTRGFLYP